MMRFAGGSRREYKVGDLLARFWSSNRRRRRLIQTSIVFIGGSGRHSAYYRADSGSETAEQELLGPDGSAGGPCRAPQGKRGIADSPELPAAHTPQAPPYAASARPKGARRRRRPFRNAAEAAFRACKRFTGMGSRGVPNGPVRGGASRPGGGGGGAPRCGIAATQASRWNNQR